MIRKAAATVIALCLSASPLHAQNAPATKLIVNEASATVHLTPSVASPVVGNASRGTEIVVTREVGDWVKIAWPSATDGIGYVRKSMLAHVAVTPAVAKTSAAAPASVNAKAAAAPAPSMAPVAAREQIPVSQPRVPQTGTRYVAPTHIFGVGAVTGSSRGFGGSARGWKAGRLGVQVEVSRFTYDSVDLLSRTTVTDFAPGVLFALNDHVTDTLWLRPYVGAGAHFARSSRTDLIFPGVVAESANTMGIRGFVGGEMSLASAPQLAVSVDVGYYHQPEPFIGFEPSGIGVTLSGHWYVR
jgi:hypothetical protein